MQKERSYAEVYNDLDGEIVNVFKVLRDPVLSAQLIESCSLTPFSRDEFSESYVNCDDPVEQARRTLFRAEAGFGSGGAVGMSTGFRSDSKRDYGLAAHIWSRYPEKIATFGERLRGVIIENRPAVDVIKLNDGPDTLHFVDPPYVHDTRVMRSNSGVYRHEMTDDQHIELLETLNAVEGAVVLSGYPSELYEGMLKNWDRYSKSARISSGRGTGLREEVVWVNARCADEKPQREMF